MTSGHLGGFDEGDFQALRSIAPARALEVRDVAGVNVEDLDRPTILRGATAGWRAETRWASRQVLEEHYGATPVRVWGGDVYSGALYARRRNAGARRPLARYLGLHDAGARGPPPAGAESRQGSPYVFENEFSGPRGEFLADIGVPECFAPDVFERLPALRKAMPQYRWFLCGLRGSGSAIRVDPRGTAAWNALLAGAKRWWFFPPDQSPAFREAIGAAGPDAEPEPPLHWWRSRQRSDGGAALSAWGMLEAVQLPGETVFVPQGWWHQVLNLDFTTSWTQNFVLPAMLPTAFAEWRRDWPVGLRIYAHAPRPPGGDAWPDPDAPSDADAAPPPREPLAPSE